MSAIARVYGPCGLLQVVAVQVLRLHHEGGPLVLRELAAPRLELGRSQRPHVAHPLLEAVARLASPDGVSALLVAGLVHEEAVLLTQQLGLAGVANALGLHGGGVSAGSGHL